MQREEMVALAVVLQSCPIHARTSLNVFCRGVQDLHKCLVPVVEEGNLFNREKEIWEGVGRTHSLKKSHFTDAWSTGAYWCYFT